MLFIQSDLQSYVQYMYIIIHRFQSNTRLMKNLGSESVVLILMTPVQQTERRTGSQAGKQFITLSKGE